MRLTIAKLANRHSVVAVSVEIVCSYKQGKLCLNLMFNLSFQP